MPVGEQDGVLEDRTSALVMYFPALSTQWTAVCAKLDSLTGMLDAEYAQVVGQCIFSLGASYTDPVRHEPELRRCLAEKVKIMEGRLACLSRALVIMQRAKQGGTEYLGRCSPKEFNLALEALEFVTV